MARSTVIYVVMKWGVPIGAFTVKHELKSFVEKAGNNPFHLYYRVKDGMPAGVVEEIFYPFELKRS